MAGLINVHNCFCVSHITVHPMGASGLGGGCTGMGDGLGLTIFHISFTGSHVTCHPSGTILGGGKFGSGGVV